MRLRTGHQRRSAQPIPADGGAFTVHGKISPGNYAWIEVEDDGGPWTPAACDPERGHGLDIIRALADDWGIDGDHTGRTVWARFDWPSHDRRLAE